MTELWNALDRLEGGKKWAQGAMYCKSDGARCMLGAIGNADAETYDDYSILREHEDDVAAVAGVIKAQFPSESWTDDNIHTVWCFNDERPVDGYDDVRLVMEKAAISRDEILS